MGMGSTCNQCHQIMEIEVDADIMVCNNPVCPNYGLLQIGIEDMLDREDGIDE